MSQANTSKLSTWILWAPIKFSIITFICLTIVGLLYTFIAAQVYAPAPIPTKPIIWLCAITFIGCIAHMFYKLPRIHFDHTSFVAVHNSQMLISSNHCLKIPIFKRNRTKHSTIQFKFAKKRELWNKKYKTYLSSLSKSTDPS